MPRLSFGTDDVYELSIFLLKVENCSFDVVEYLFGSLVSCLNSMSKLHVTLSSLPLSQGYALNHKRSRLPATHPDMNESTRAMHNYENVTEE